MKGRHSVGIAFALAHVAEDKGPNKDDDDFISQVVGGVFNYRSNHLFVEVGPAVVLNRGPSIGVLFQVGYFVKL